MNLALRLIPVAIVVAALAPRRHEPVIDDREWSASGFRESLSRAAEEARGDLAAAPGIHWADVRVRSEEDHAPLKVEASVTWSGALSESRRDALRSLVKARFDSFACVEVVLAGEANR